ncbi:N-acetylneuraminate synthase [uncultured Bacteroides sp.]|uniref:N-acetylneuraminate synthase n=1 Tax=uncultured Bacteroides sp. TaxID=162156 RepID=UPI0027D967BA|nr:N-acetylneuraminate synthase [uncultured Bacteroides sp.]
MSKTYIIAEAGVNHNGRLDLALKLCDAAKECGVDAIKFQTWKTELIIAEGTKMAEYQKNNLNTEESQFEMLKKLELSYDQFTTIKEYCNKIGIQFLSTADETESLDFLCELGIPFIKLGSGDINNVPYLRYVAGKGIPVILSTGMSSMKDVVFAYDTLKEAGADDITVLHCTTNYPCPMNEVNLRSMITIKDTLKCRVGYSDHTMGTEVPVAAVALGAEVIEKHFTLDRNMEGPDHPASLEPHELKEMVRQIRNIETALGNGIKEPNESERKISSVVLKKILAKKKIRKGEILSADNLNIKRAESGISAEYWDLIVDTEARYDYNIDEPIRL